MQFLPILVAILLGGCALIFVLYPIYERMKLGGGGDPALDGAPALNRPPTLNESSALNGTPALENSQAISTNAQAEREQAARTALQEVELDFQLGNLAETDYRSLRERYMRRALLAMKSRHDREQELDEAIEEQLRRMRETDEANQSIEHHEHELR